MKKFLPYILILTIILQIFAPFTIGSGVNNNLEIQTNKAEAIDFDETEQGFKTAFIEGDNGPTESDLVLTNQITTENSVSIYLKATLDTGYSVAEDVVNIYKHLNGFSQGSFDNNTLILVVKEKEGGQITGIIDITDGILQDYQSLPQKITKQGININTSTTPNVFTLEKEYSITFYYQATASGRGWGESIPSISNNKDYYPIATTIILIGPAGTAVGPSNYMEEEVTLNNAITNPLDCSWKNFKGCVAMVPYYLLFVPTSAIFSISGKIFDFAFGYSVQDSSYRSTFVVEGWGIIRDFCNMFFIFILLYIAFGTILNLNSVKTKEMIINVVIIGLLINFSLFATHLIIDASNILARVFYNSETIKITEKNPDGSVKAVDSGEYIKLSEAIVSKVNPQELVLKAGTVGNIPDKGGMGEQTGPGEISLATLVLIILLASAVNIVGIIVFISVALIFVGRVIGLWLAMIFVPFAFFTYAVPSLQDLDMVGWKKWWPETIKMAFLAPIFMFFMYLIIKFLNLKLDLVNTTGKSSMDFIVAILIPFAFIMILLWKAKDIAKKMSGTVGEMVTKGGAIIGGVALGAGAGLGAMAMRGTVGRIGNKLATSEFAKTNGAIGRGLGNLGKWVGGGSMDIRGVKIAGKGLSDTGLKNVGKAKEGGYAKHLSDKVERKQKRAKELEVSENEPLKQSLNQTEMDLQKLLSENKQQLDNLDKNIEAKRQALNDVNAHFGAGTAEALAAGKELQDAKDAKTNFRKTIKAKGKYTFVDESGVTRTEDRTIENIEKYEMRDKKNAIENENRERRNKYARKQARWGGRANKEAEHKIIMDTKLDSGTKT